VKDVTAESFWPSPPVELALGDSEVHVWAVPLDLDDAAIARFAPMLSSDERERAARFKFEVHRKRFIAARGWMREILSRCLRVAPEKIGFDYSPNGKPALARACGDSKIHFNLAHSRDLALFALTRIGPLGVDVEQIREVKDMEHLVARFFSKRETELFRTVAEQDRPRAFFNLWTRKEAMLKATGEGITRSLDRVEVSFLPGEPARVIAIEGDESKAARWRLIELAPAPGYTGALASEGPKVRVRLCSCLSGGQ